MAERPSSSHQDPYSNSDPHAHPPSAPVLHDQMQDHPPQSTEFPAPTSDMRDHGHDVYSQRAPPSHYAPAPHPSGHPSYPPQPGPQHGRVHPAHEGHHHYQPPPSSHYAPNSGYGPPHGAPQHPGHYDPHGPVHHPDPYYYGHPGGHPHHSGYGPIRGESSASNSTGSPVTPSSSSSLPDTRPPQEYWDSRAPPTHHAAHHYPPGPPVHPQHGSGYPPPLPPGHYPPPPLPGMHGHVHPGGVSQEYAMGPPGPGYHLPPMTSGHRGPPRSSTASTISSTSSTSSGGPSRSSRKGRSSNASESSTTSAGSRAKKRSRRGGGSDESDLDEALMEASADPEHRKEEARKQRMDAEQRRRDQLRDGYERLQSALPGEIQKDKLSKVRLIESATLHIVKLHELQAQYQAKFEMLERQTADLRRQNEEITSKMMASAPARPVPAAINTDDVAAPAPASSASAVTPTASTPPKATAEAKTSPSVPAVETESTVEPSTGEEAMEKSTATSGNPPPTSAIEPEASAPTPITNGNKSHVTTVTENKGIEQAMKEVTPIEEDSETNLTPQVTTEASKNELKDEEMTEA